MCSRCGLGLHLEEHGDVSQNSFRPAFVVVVVGLLVRLFAGLIFVVCLSIFVLLAHLHILYEARTFNSPCHFENK